MSIQVQNPHSILKALELRPKDFIEIRLKSPSQGVWLEIQKKAEKSRVSIRSLNPGKDKTIGPGVAVIKEKSDFDLQDLLSEIDTNKPSIWLALDQVQDPHNLGAIFRSAAFFGVQGILMTERRSSHLTSIVYDTSCGGVEVVAHSFISNLNQAIEACKKAGLWILALSEHAKQSLEDIPFDRPFLLVLGNEGEGVRPGVIKNADFLCALKSKGEIASLNVSVATAVTLALLGKAQK